MNKTVLLIAGPTASGKSGIAMEMACASDGVIINADSMQVYQDLAVLTARPGVDDLQKTPHRLYGTMDGGEACSVAKWLAAARMEIELAWDKGYLPILVGGTGLYFRALLEGLSPILDIPGDIRNVVRDFAIGDLYQALQQEDPAMAARLNPGDRQRIARALEVKRASGKSILEWQAMAGGGLNEYGADIKVTKIILSLPREELYARANARFEAMMKDGAIEEVQRLLDRHLDSSLPVMKAIGVQEIAGYLKGEHTLEDVIRLGSQGTRRYAKRQLTWFRNQCADWVWYEDADTEGMDYADLL